MDKLPQWRYNFKTDELAKFRGCSCYMLIYYCKIDEDFIALLVNKGPSRNEITEDVIDCGDKKYAFTSFGAECFRNVVLQRFKDGFYVEHLLSIFGAVLNLGE